ncbi:aldo/keto reductase [Polyangium aurulentum]|uniref:aldo/keto reductase n=1 Tax=Polyangium aurulentum TaxID=2567896 RepID=UPI0010ADE846|nr:aldo/keto reductase [Polyangium aurulentum]UQA56788.1 aldo/keto reductase [Polyangium aurulentum]
MSASWSPVRLGKSDLEVVPLGIASGYDLPGREVERAFERGVDFFYWGTARRPDFGAAVRRLALKNRERMKIVIQSYARSGDSIGSSLDKALAKLGLGYADMLLLGWWNLPPHDAILDAAADLVRRGRARKVMVSCHHRPTFPRLARDPRIDALMIRYNAAHPGAEKDVFPHLSEPRPGIVTYTTTSWGQLLDRALVPPGERVPTATDCYRFALSNPNVNACWAGAKNASELDAALAALDAGPMSEDELAWMRRVGVAVRDATGKATRVVGMNFADRVINLVSGFGFRATSDLPRE